MHVSDNTQFMFCILATSLHLSQITYGGVKHIYRDGGNGPAALVLAGQIFSQGKNESPFLHKVSNKQKC